MSDHVRAVPIFLTRVDTSLRHPKRASTAAVDRSSAPSLYGKWYCTECGKALAHVLGRPIR